MPEVVRDRTLVLFSEAYEEKAMNIVNSFRNDGLKTALLKRDSSVSDEQYEKYADSILAGGILFVDSPDKIRIKDLKTGEIREKEI